jgi:hypothetical protein
MEIASTASASGLRVEGMQASREHVHPAFVYDAQADMHKTVDS